MRRLGLLLALALAGCTTHSSRPLLPDPAVGLEGKWRIVALTDERVSGARYEADFEVGHASFRTGCNASGGSYRLADGWLVKTSDWIVTTAGCNDQVSSRHEDKGLRILSQPLAIERTSKGVRLRNRLGWLDLDR